MAWKMSSWSGSTYSGSSGSDYIPDYQPARPQPPSAKPYQPGALVAHVGTARKCHVSRERREEHTEKIPKIDDNLLAYNLDGRNMLIRCKQNQRSFDIYVSLPFVKGVTELGTGRTLVIVGSDAHHGEAMQNQFPGVLWSEDEEKKQYGKTIRWINVGDTQEGFIGIDYNPKAKDTGGVARKPDDVQFLAKTLLEVGYDPQKRLYLLKPPYIVEREEGRKWREG